MVESAVDLSAGFGRMVEKAKANPDNVHVTIDSPVTEPALAAELRLMLLSRLDRPFGYEFGGE